MTHPRRTSMDAAHWTSQPRDVESSGVLDFFNQPPEPTPAPAPEPERASIDERFAEFDAANPELWAEIVKRAHALVDAGARHVGVRLIIESVRYDCAVRALPGDYKINDNFISRYARKLIEHDPALAEKIETRALRSA